MKRITILAGVLLVGSAVSALAGTIIQDPMGFCTPGTDCFTATGIGGETIGVSTKNVELEHNGSMTTASPWDLLVAVPDGGLTAPTLSIAGFTELSVSIGVAFLPTTHGSIYDLFHLTGDASMNAANMFGANIVPAFGSTPTSFQVFEYTFTPGFGPTPTSLPITANLVDGTYLAATDNTHPFSTPFTTTGLVNGTGCPDCAIIPEPSLTSLLAGGLSLIGILPWRKRRQQA